MRRSVFSRSEPARSSAAAAHEVGFELGLGVPEGNPSALGRAEFGFALGVELREELGVDFVQVRIGLFEAGVFLLIHLRLGLGTGHREWEDGEKKQREETG